MSENELKAEKMRNIMAWTCEYCRQHGMPMDHGCLPVNLKKEISRLTLERDQARTELKNVKELFEEAVRQKDEAHHLLGKERDEFGKKEIELMRENGILKNFIEERQTKIQELTKELKRLKNINVRPASWVAVLNDHDRRVEGLQAELEAARGEKEIYRKIAIDRSFSGVAEPFRLGNERLERLRIVFGKEVDDLVALHLAKLNQHFQDERL